MDGRQDIAKDTWLAKIPDWLRWILFLPASIIGAVAGSTLFMIIIAIGGQEVQKGSLNGGWQRLVQSGILGGLVVIIGAYVSPKMQFIVGIALLVLVAIILTFITTAGVYSGVGSNWYQIMHGVAALLGGGVALYSVYDSANKF